MNLHNSALKHTLQRRSIEWEVFLNEIIDEIEEDGFPLKPHKTQVERLILHHKTMPTIKKEIIDGFKGIQKVNKQTRRWMNGE